MQLACPPASSTTLETAISVAPVSPGSSLVCRVPGVSAGWQHPSPAPVQLAGHLSLVLYGDAVNDNYISMTIQQPPINGSTGSLIQVGA